MLLRLRSRKCNIYRTTFNFLLTMNNSNKVFKIALKCADIVLFFATKPIVFMPQARLSSSSLKYQIEYCLSRKSRTYFAPDM